MDKETIRINFKGGSLNGKSTLKNEPFIVNEGLIIGAPTEIYKLEVTNKTISHLRYKFIGNGIPIDAEELQA